MAKSTIQGLFAVEKEETEEEKEERKKKDQENNNPFLHRNSLDPDNGDGALRISLDNMGDSVEKYYFWFQKFLTAHKSTSFGAPAKKLLKLKDVFDASVSSSFHGQVGSKTSAMQQQISTYLTQIGQLTKTIFPMVREIRMMDERMEYYRESLGKPKGDDGARQNEVTLKSTWIEMVEQGMQNPNSVYSLSTKLGFVTLPDLFFGITPHGKTPEEQKKRLVKILNAMEKEKAFNKKVRDVLDKKLTQYYTWKQTTWKEMQHTRKFRIKALKQHYNVIKLYTSWLKPYLTALKALQMKGDTSAHEMVGSFETSKLELELLAIMGEGKVGDEDNPPYSACLLIRLKVVTRPDLIFAGQGQRQVQHSGHIQISIEPYVATKEDIKYYSRHTDKEIVKGISGVEYGDMIGDIETMLGSIGDDVEAYLEEAEHGPKKKEEEKEEIEYTNPITSFVESFGMFWPDSKKKDKKKKEFSKAEAKEREKEKKSLEKKASKMAWVVYDVFKKTNGLLSF